MDLSCVFVRQGTFATHLIHAISLPPSLYISRSLVNYSKFLNFCYVTWNYYCAKVLLQWGNK